MEHDYSVKKPAPSNLFNELFRYINIFAKILSLLGFDSLYQKILGKTKEVPSLRFKTFVIGGEYQLMIGFLEN